MTDEESLDALLERIDQALTELDDEALPLEQAFSAYTDGLQALQSGSKFWLATKNVFRPPSASRRRHG